MRYVLPLLLALLLAPAAALAQADLFTPNAAARAALAPEAAGALAHLEGFAPFVQAELGRVDPAALTASVALHVALPDGEEVTLRPVRVEDRAPLASGGVDRSWYGAGAGAGTTGQFVVRGDVVVGTVRHAGRLYTLRALGGGLHALALLDEQRFPSEHETRTLDDRGRAPAPPARSPSLTPSPAAGASSSLSTIDVIVPYTNFARADAGGTDAILASIQLAVDESNQSFANSSVALEFRLAHAYETPTFQIGVDDDLDDVTFIGEGRFDEVHGLRDQYGADVVSLWGSYGNDCGDGWIAGPMPESYAFSVVNYSCATGTYGFAHQIAHNLGAHHEPGYAVNHFFSFGYGYNSSYTPDGWKTIMAEGPGTRIPYWSNPDVLYNGVPTGVPDVSDNVRTINQTAPIVAEYRPSVVGPGCEQSLDATLSNATPAAGQTVTFAVTATNDSATPTDVDLWIDASGPASARLRLTSGTLPSSATVTANVAFRIPTGAPAGAYALDLNLGDFAADEVCDTEPFTMTVGPAARGVAASGVAFEAVGEAAFAEAPAPAAAMARTAEAALAVAPNPLAGQATVRYALAEAGAVRLAVYDVLGREVAVLADEHREGGAHEAAFDASALPAGAYVVRLAAGGRVETRRVTVLR